MDNLDLVQISIYALTLLGVLIFVGVMDMLIDKITRPKKVRCMFCNKVVPYEKANKSELFPNEFVCDCCKYVENKK